VFPPHAAGDELKPSCGRSLVIGDLERAAKNAIVVVAKPKHSGVV
jgi:hypothetical protein